MSTTPECAYIGGHTAGYDDDCHWCHRARYGSTPRVQHDTDKDTNRADLHCSPYVL
jgi:hypothetical protein